MSQASRRTESRAGGRTRQVGYVVLAACMTGAAPVLTKLALRDLSVETILTWRYVLAALVVLPMLALRRPAAQQEPARRKTTARLSLAVVALFGSGASALLFTGSLLYAPAAVANALSKTGPLLVAFLAYVWLQEPVSLGGLSLVASMLLAAGLLGAGEFTGGGAAAGAPMLGVAMAVGAGLLRASAEVAAKAALGTWQPAQVALARFAGGAVMAVAVAMVRHAPLAVPQGAGQWALLGALAAFCTGVPIVLYYTGMARLPVHQAAGLRTSGTAVTAVASWLALGEKLGSLHLLGLGSLLCAAYAMAHMPAERRRPRVPLLRLSSRLVTFVAAVVALSILVAGALQAWQLHGLLAAEVEASLTRSAALIGHVVSIQGEVTPSVLRRYFSALVQERMGSPGYSAEFSYIVLADAAGVPVAWAFRDTDWPPGSGAETARSLAAGGAAMKGNNLIPVNVTVRSGDITMRLLVGYRARVAAGPLLALSLRTALLAGLLALAAGAAAAGLVRGALAPLASASAEVRGGVERPRGDDLPPLAPGMADGWAAALAAGGDALPPGGLPRRGVLCAVRPAEMAAAASRLPAWLAEAAEDAAGLGGRLVGVRRGWLLAAWGLEAEEMDEPLRAYAWASATPAAAALLLAGDDAGTLEDLLARAEGATASGADTLLAGPGFIRAVEDRLPARPAGDVLWAVTDGED